jgi:hypothetical protein
MPYATVAHPVYAQLPEGVTFPGDLEAHSSSPCETRAPSSEATTATGTDVGIGVEGVVVGKARANGACTSVKVERELGHVAPLQAVQGSQRTTSPSYKRQNLTSISSESDMS